MLAFFERSNVHPARSSCSMECRRTAAMTCLAFWLRTVLVKAMRYGPNCRPGETDERAMSSAKPS